LKSLTHWFCKTLFVVYVLAIIWTSLAYAFEDKVTAIPIPSSSALSRVTSTPQGRLRFRAYVEGAAKIRGVNPRVAEWIVTHESRHHPEATGDGGESRGLWQINKAWHPEVSDACAYNVTCSTDWSLERIRAGHIDEWRTWKYCKERFEDCPFNSKK
jgi:Lysozyme like domain